MTTKDPPRADDRGADPVAGRVADPVLEVRDASVTFEMDRGVSRVLDGVNLDVDRREILGIVGESGSGKSMFASSLLDAVVDPGRLTGEITYRPASGEPVDVLALDDDERRSFRWSEVAMVFQGAMSSFNPTITIRKHVEETLRSHGRDVEAGMRRARQLLADLYLDADRVLDAYAHELSGGMKQRALIALSLVLEPEVLVMDEPTAALDLLMQRSILGLLEELQEKYDLTVVFISHDLPLVADVADRLAVMYGFEFVELGPTASVLDEPAHPYTRALLRSVPDLDAPLGELRHVEGSSPDPVNVPEGCRYHPRCAHADEQCRLSNPGYSDAGDGRAVACHHWETADDGDAVGTASVDEPTVVGGEQSDDPVVSLRDLHVHFEADTGWLPNPFRRPDVVRAVDGVDLDVYENDVVALIGESGCGKTTLGKAAIAARRPTSGRVDYRGQDVWAARDGDGDVDIPFGEIRRSLQIVHQDPGSSLNPHRTVRSILRKPIEAGRAEVSPATRERRITELLRYVGMTPPEDYADRYPHQLSGGEQQRVALVRALLTNPDLILADEAVSALDVSLRVEMMDLMLDLQAEFDTSFLFVSHNLANARYFAGKAGGRIGVMYLGELVEIGPAEEVVADPKHPYTKALNWATTELDADDTIGDPPIEGIDVPDPVNPPTGCRFHTRCPEAREACTREAPSIDGGDDGPRGVACFRERGEDHPYWSSDPVEGRTRRDPPNS